LIAALAAASPSAAYNVYYANLHAHTVLSDGIGTPAEAYAHARDVAGIHILALTEHTHMLTVSEFNELTAAAWQFSQPGVFVALAAQEYGILTDFGHINIFDAPSRNPQPTDNLPATYHWMNVNGAFGAFNHPNPDYGTNFENLAFHPEYVDAMRMIEVRNGLATRGYEEQYIQALDNGWRIGPTANQDNHEGHWGDQRNPYMSGRIYLTGVLADSLTTEEVLGAFRARRFFAMEVDPPSDRIELDFRIDGSPMGSEIVVGPNPHVTVRARGINGVSLFNRVQLYRDGLLYNSQILVGNEIFYEFVDGLVDGESHYYFVKVRQVDSDLCWSSPIWVRAEVQESAVEQRSRSERLRVFDTVALTNSAPLRFELPARTGQAPPITLTLYDARGRRVRDLDTRAAGVGPNVVVWDCRDVRGERVAPGMYFARLAAPGIAPGSARVILLR